MAAGTLKPCWYVTAVLMVAAACVVVIMARVRSDSSAGEHFASFPRQIGSWHTVRDIQYDDSVMRTLGTRDVFGRACEDDAGNTLDFVVVHSVNNRSSFHPPEYCLTGGGSEIIEKRDGAFTAEGRKYTVNEMVFLRNNAGGSRLLVWNWYAAGKNMDANFYRQQRKLFFNQLRTGRSPGTVVNIYVPAAPDNIQQARAAAEDFAASLVPALEGYLD